MPTHKVTTFLSEISIFFRENDSHKAMYTIMVNFYGSSLSHILHRRKDVFNRFMTDPQINWRKLLYRLNIQLWNKIKVRTEHKEGTNILSVVKRFTAYETIGILFEDISKDSLELSVTDRIWGVLQEIVIAIANLFGLVDEEIYDAIINRSEELTHICDIYKLKLAS